MSVRFEELAGRVEVIVDANSVSKRQEWRQALTSSLPQRNEIARTLAPTLSAGELQELVEILRSGTPEEKDTALRLLGPIVRSRDAEIQNRLPSDWKTAAWAILRERTFSAEGTLAWHLLVHVDRDGVNDFLTSLPLTELSDAERILLMGRLSRAPRADALAKFREIEALGGYAAAEAKRQREKLGGSDDVTLEAIAEDWRRNHSRESLNRLCNVCISHLSTGVPITRLFELLGAPNHQSLHDYRWVTDDEEPLQLAVFTDMQDRIDRWKLQ